MKTFDFTQDHKKTIWYRQRFSIEAETLEEAKAIAIRMASNDLHIDNDDWDILYDTIETVPPTENGGFCTRELFAESESDSIWDNGIKTIELDEPEQEEHKQFHAYMKQRIQDDVRTDLGLNF